MKCSQQCECLNHQQLGREWAKPYQQPNAGETKRFWRKILEQKDHNKKAKWINNVETELRMLEEGPQVNIYPDGLKTTLKKIANWETPGIDDIHGFWSKRFTSIHDRLATEMNKCIQKTDTRMDDWNENHSDSKRPPQMNRPKQLSTHNMPTDDVENTKSTN